MALVLDHEAMILHLFNQYAEYFRMFDMDRDYAGFLLRLDAIFHCMPSTRLSKAVSWLSRSFEKRLDNELLKAIVRWIREYVVELVEERPWRLRARRIARWLRWLVEKPAVEAWWSVFNWVMSLPIPRDAKRRRGAAKTLANIGYHVIKCIQTTLIALAISMTAALALAYLFPQSLIQLYLQGGVMA